MTIGTACQWFFIRAVRDKAIRAGGKAPPEARLPVGMAGALVCPIGLLWFALSSYSEMTFFMPLIGIMIFGVGVSQPLYSKVQLTISRYSSSLVFGDSWWLVSQDTQLLPWRVIPSSGVFGQLGSRSLPIQYVYLFSLSLYACHSLISDVPRTRSSQSHKYPSWSSSCNGTNTIRTLFLRIKVEESINVFKMRTIDRMKLRVCILSSDTN
jgi:hypothetical protein